MWIHVPNSYLVSAPEPGDSTEASTWRSEMLARSASLNTKQAPSSSWLRAWKKGTWTTALFGRICTPSEAESGVAAFRESLLEYPASRTAWPERDSGQTTSVTSGLSLQPSFEMFGLDGSSSKTSPESSGTTLSASGPSYRLWVTALRKSSSRRRKLGRHTSANASSYWQPEGAEWRTPDAPGQGGPRNRQASRGHGHQETIGEQAENWPTPRSEDSESAGNHPKATDSLTGATTDWQTPAADSFRSRGGERVAEMGLDQQARGWWATPRAVEGKTGPEGSASFAYRLEKGYLDAQAENWITPSANEDTAGTVDGQMQQMLTHQSKSFLPATADAETTAPAGKTDAQPATPGDESLPSAPTSRRQLNPKFVSWMMGWEPSWTSLAPLSCDSRETGLYLNRPPTPSGSSNWPTPDTQNIRGGR